MERETNEGRERNAEIAGRLGINRQTNRRILQNTRTSKSEQEDALREYAKQNNIWLDEKDIDENSSRKIPSGKEANVYLNKDGKNVTKVINYSKYSKSPAEFVQNRILLNNQLFKDTPYEIIGFTKNEKGFSFVVKQPFIKGKELDKLATSVESLTVQQKKVADYMKERFGMKPNGLDSFSNDDFTISDLHLKNVIEGENENLYIIDSIPSINETSELNASPEPSDGGSRYRTCSYSKAGIWRGFARLRLSRSNY